MTRYADLPLVEGTGERHCWSEFGAEDELGSLNRLTPEIAIAASRLVRSGKTFSLDLPLNEPGIFGDMRPVYTHNVSVAGYGRDDSLDGFFMSASSQWDGLRHVRYREHGYYGGRQENDLDGSRAIGIDRVAEKGLVTRAVLLDIPNFMRQTGREWNADTKFRVATETLEEILDYEGVQTKVGDVLLVRTGWLESWLARPRGQRPNGIGQTPGLDPGRQTAEWLWDRGIVGVAADNLAVEPVPYTDRGDGHLHFRLIPLLGIYMGELFDLRALSQDCIEDGIFEGMFVSSPLKVPSGVCSPPNAYFIK